MGQKWTVDVNPVNSEQTRIVSSQVTITANVIKLYAISGHYLRYYISVYICYRTTPKCGVTLHMPTEQSFLDKVICYNVYILLSKHCQIVIGTND